MVLASAGSGSGVVVPEVGLGRGSRGGDGPWASRQPEVVEDGSDRLGMGEHGEHAHAPVAVGTFEDIDGEHAGKEGCPGDPLSRRGKVEPTGIGSRSTMGWLAAPVVSAVLAGAMAMNASRSLAAEASRPWKRKRFWRGGGTSQASLRKKAVGGRVTWVWPLYQGRRRR